MVTIVTYNDHDDNHDMMIIAMIIIRIRKMKRRMTIIRRRCHIIDGDLMTRYFGKILTLAAGIQNYFIALKCY